MATVRRPKWHPPPPQTPRILHLPRPARRRQAARSAGAGRSASGAPKGKLETLSGQERTFCYTIPPVVLLNSKETRDNAAAAAAATDGVQNGIWEEKWRFQAEILRAECKFLRMERDITAKRLDRERVFMERTLKSAAHALVYAKRKIGEGKNVDAVLEEEIEGLTKKLAEIQRTTKKATRRDPKLLKGERAGSNFDKGATLLQKQLERIGGLPRERCKMNVREIAKANLLRPGTTGQGSADVEVLRRKMEGLSKGKLLKEMEEEYGSMSSGTANSASNSKPSSSLQEPMQETKVCEQNICAGHCKGIVRRIMEQVRAETEQWSQMQEMLGKVREEMEELQGSRDFWEDRALDCDFKIKSLNKTVQEWKQKASSLEIKEKQQEDLVRLLQEELERARIEKAPARVKSKELHEKENKVLMCRVKGNRKADDTCIKTRDTVHDGRKVIDKGGSKLTSPSRLPFLDIGNLSPLVRQTSRRSVFPLRSPQH